VPTCARCGGDVPEGADRCEHCGHLLVAPSAEPGPAAFPGAPRVIAGVGCGVLTVMLVLISIVVVLGALLGGLVGAAGARVS
jgi:hypothetical protein